MKEGTWGVSGNVSQRTVDLELVLTMQEEILRAIPEKSLKSKKSYLLKIRPGKIDKRHILPKLSLEIPNIADPQEILSALPAGGLSIIK